MTIEHSALTGGQLHEPKGVASANANDFGFASSSAISWGKLTGSATATASSSSKLEFTNLGDYLMVRLTFVNLRRATSSTTLRLSLSTNNGSSYTSSSVYGTRWMDAGGAASDEAASFNLSGDNTLLYNTGVVCLYNLGTVQETSMQGHMICSSSTGGGGTASGQYIVGIFQTSAAVDALKITSSSGNLTSGSVYLEGFKGGA